VSHAFKVLIGKPEGKSPLGRPRHRWNDIKINLTDIGWGVVNWIHLAQDMDQWQVLVDMVMNLWVA
jgi:hypothetical protein